MGEMRVFDGRETALPCPFYTVGKRHCRVLFSFNVKRGYRLLFGG